MQTIPTTTLHASSKSFSGPAKIAQCAPLAVKGHPGMVSACQQPCQPGQDSSDGCIPTCQSEGNCGQAPTPPPNNTGAPPDWNNCIIDCVPPGSAPGPCDVAGRHADGAKRFIRPGPPGGCNPGVPVARSNGPAQYNDQCTKDAEIVGHDLPSFSDKSHAIINEYPVSLGNSLIGYVYTTWGTGNGAGGKAYFVPVSSSVGAGVVSIGVDTSFPTGTNGFIQSQAGNNTLLTVLIKVITAGKAPTLAKPCYTSDWDGTYPT